MTFTWGHAVLFFLTKASVYIRMTFGYVYAPFIAESLNVPLKLYFVPWTCFEFAASLQGAISLMFPLPSSRGLFVSTQILAAIAILIVPILPFYDSVHMHIIVLSIALAVAGFFNNIVSAMLSSSVIDFTSEKTRGSFMSFTEGGWTFAQYCLTPAGILLTYTPLWIWFAIVNGPSLICAALTFIFYPGKGSLPKVPSLSENTPLVKSRNEVSCKEYFNIPACFFFGWWFTEGGVMSLIYSSFGLWFPEQYGLNASELGYASLFLATGQLVGCVVSTFCSDSYGPALVSLHSSIAASIFMIIFLLFHSVFNIFINLTLFLCMVIFTEFTFLSQLAIADKFTPRKGQTYITTSLAFSFCGASRGIFALIVPYLWEYSGIVGIFMTISVGQFAVIFCVFYQVYSHPTFFFHNNKAKDIPLEP